MVVAGSGKNGQGAEQHQHRGKHGRHPFASGMRQRSKGQ
jgi:hypothetical protein